MTIQSKKGSWCPYRSCLVCQEGYCQDCEVYYTKDPQTVKQLEDLIAMKEATKIRG